MKGQFAPMSHIDGPQRSRYRAALAAIWDRSGYDRGFISNPFAGDNEARRGLARTSEVLQVLANPQERMRLIHVAGSKGKGSTTVLIDAILRAAGMRSGRFTSPHLHSYRERFIIDNQPIDEGAFATLTQSVMDAVRKVESTDPALGRVTAWELSTAMAMEWFAQENCDVAVIEVGLGGTLDATNVIDPIVSVVTRLDLEHTAILGDTLPEIASNKAGIIKPGRPSITVEQPPEALVVLEERAHEVGSTLLIQNRDWFIDGDEASFAVTGPWGTVEGLRTSLIGQHQVENAGLAVAAIELAMGEPSPIPQSAFIQGLLSAHHPGRFEIIRTPNRRTVIVDGAHTPVAAESLHAALRKHVPPGQIIIVVAMLDDKRPDAFLAPLVPLDARWIVTELDSPRKMPVDVLADALSGLGQRIERAPSIAKAIDLARRNGGEESVVVVTGSLTAVAEARVHLGAGFPDPPPG
jgi:dihydrofolate synthase/folylpolyglutamate synthase